MKEINTHQLQRALRMAGYEKIRNCSGSHAVYSNGEHKVSVPNSNINFKVMTKIVKDCKLKDYI